jgi:hypothetical protein
MTTTEHNVSPAARDHRRPRVPVDFTKAPGLYQRIADSARLNRRSFNAECLVRLEATFRDNFAG